MGFLCRRFRRDVGITGKTATGWFVCWGEKNVAVGGTPCWGSGEGSPERGSGGEGKLGGGEGIGLLEILTR